ncbi:MAG: hypothetical protein A2542_02800 [Parcubacteria group bacterium RIFOXYD2_FULL_52_8]|nr:MAG: hypothetical protein A2542_02800 [Parcubacteria group bacterium RIFOXYD2_FULL_52_8]
MVQAFRVGPWLKHGASGANMPPLYFCGAIDVWKRDGDDLAFELFSQPTPEARNRVSINLAEGPEDDHPSDPTCEDRDILTGFVTDEGLRLLMDYDPQCRQIEICVGRLRAPFPGSGGVSWFNNKPSAKASIVYLMTIRG